ncbi:MAG: ADP-ribosylation factor-like protein, partial [Promethearchaeota archaeon]
DNTIKIWDAESGKLLKTLEGHSSYVYSVSFSPDGTKLASGSDDHTIKIWDLEQKEAISSITFYYASSVRSIQFHPTKPLVAGGDNYGDIRIWDYFNADKIILYSQAIKIENKRVIFAGRYGAGKTSIIAKLCEGQNVSIAEMQSTLGCEVRVVPDRVGVYYWDFGGQMEFRIVHEFYSRGAIDLHVLVFDGERFGEDQIREFKYWTDLFKCDGGTNCRFLIVVNKKDALTYSIPSEFREIVKKFYEKNGIEEESIIETSARTNEGIDELRGKIEEALRINEEQETEIISEFNYAKVDRLIKEKKEKKKLFIEYEELINEIKIEHNGNEKTIEDKILWYLIQLENAGQLLILSKFGMEHNYIILNPVLLSKILSMISLYMQSRRDEINENEINEIAARLQKDKYISDLGYKIGELEEFIGKSLDIGVEMNILSRPESGYLFPKFKPRIESGRIRIEELENHQLIRCKYYKSERIADIALRNISTLLINKYNFQITQDGKANNSMYALLESEDEGIKIIIEELMIYKDSEVFDIIGYRIFNGNKEHQVLNKIDAIISLNLISFVEKIIPLSDQVIRCANCGYNWGSQPEIIYQSCPNCNNALNFEDIEFNRELSIESIYNSMHLRERIRDERVLQIPNNPIEIKQFFIEIFSEYFGNPNTEFIQTMRRAINSELKPIRIGIENIEDKITQLKEEFRIELLKISEAHTSMQSYNREINNLKKEISDALNSNNIERIQRLTQTLADLNTDINNKYNDLGNIINSLDERLDNFGKLFNQMDMDVIYNNLMQMQDQLNLITNKMESDWERLKENWKTLSKKDKFKLILKIIGPKAFDIFLGSLT